MRPPADVSSKAVRAATSYVTGFRQRSGMHVLANLKSRRKPAEPPQKNQLIARPLKTNARTITRAQATAVALPQMSQTGQ
jgi:hypothetical protein